MRVQRMKKRAGLNAKARRKDKTESEKETQKDTNAVLQKNGKTFRAGARKKVPHRRPRKPWHPERSPYRCFLPDLTGFVVFCRTGLGLL